MQIKLYINNLFSDNRGNVTITKFSASPLVIESGKTVNLTCCVANNYNDYSVCWSKYNGSLSVRPHTFSCDGKAYLPLETRVSIQKYTDADEVCYQLTVFKSNSIIRRLIK